MKRVVLFLILTLGGQLWAQSLHITRAVALSHNVGTLAWDSLPGAVEYRLYRQFPDEAPAFRHLATLPGTAYLDTLTRTICADTVAYHVSAVMGDTLIPGDTAGIFYRDDVPTAPCSLRLCSVDTALGLIRLSWYPSPDTDVMGYYLCRSLSGGPCIEYDTVWGRLNTTYLCPEPMSDTVPEYSFRILAFDSCLQASALTPYYHNIGLHFDSADCSRRFAATFTGYDNMPDSVRRYRFHYRLGGDTVWHHRDYAPTASAAYRFDTVIPDLAVRSVYCYVQADNRSDTLHAGSVAATFRFTYGDTAQYLAVTRAEYDEQGPAVTLTLDIDPAFAGQWCYLYRLDVGDTAFHLIDSIDRFSPAATDDAGRIQYTDSRINILDTLYCYRLGIPDLCHQWVKLSDTLCVALPELPEPQAWLPNVLIAGDAERGRFCPRFTSVRAADYQLDIFNRMGQHLFHTSQLDDCWDGTHGGILLPQGVYVYRIRCRHGDGTLHTLVGCITLLR